MADETQESTANKAVKRIARRRKEDLSWVLSDAKGRRFLWELMGDCGLFRSTFATNALLMARAEGERAAGLRVLESILASQPAAFPVMQAEAQQQKEIDNA